MAERMTAEDRYEVAMRSLGGLARNKPKRRDVLISAIRAAEAAAREEAADEIERLRAEIAEHQRLIVYANSQGFVWPYGVLHPETPVESNPND